MTGLCPGPDLGIWLWLALAAAPPAPASPGITVAISGLHPLQGEILELKIIDDRVTRVAGAKGEKNFFFFPAPERKGEWLALVPFDLEDPPGDYPLGLTMWTSAGREERKEITVTLAPGQFGRSELRLPRGQVNPPKKKKAQIAAERALLKKVFGTVSPGIQISGRFVLPFPGFHGVAFGEERILNGVKRGPHGGADCGTREGTSVSASNAGTVVLSRSLYYEGNAVIIDHGLGIYTFYLHLRKAGVTEGQKVERGDVIGWVGHTGRGTGPHLHFGVKILGERVDPNQLWNFSFD
ncbi:MAG: M23 family metallopeptidase [Proteobacteria bacterium]|nr:M23 family metallopeptidase [Pseudomonadota bacterium]